MAVHRGGHKARGGTESITFSPWTPWHGHRETSAATAGMRGDSTPHSLSPPHASTGAHLQQARHPPASSFTLPGVTCQETRSVNTVEVFFLRFSPKQTPVTQVTWGSESRHRATGGHLDVIRSGQSEAQGPRAQTHPAAPPAQHGAEERGGAVVSCSPGPTEDPPP